MNEDLGVDVISRWEIRTKRGRTAPREREVPVVTEAPPAAARPRRILLVEDNAALAKGLRNNLEVEGYDVELAADGETALAAAARVRPDLVILDLMLPDVDGYRVLSRLRAAGDDVPVLILTARGEESDKVLGFRHGADDYVTKPFGLLELLGRVGAILRRSAGVRAASGGEAPIRFGDIEIVPGSHAVLRRGFPVALRPKEYELLLSLVRRRGRVVTRADLLREVWGYSADVMSRTVDTHLGELRRKLEDDPANPRYFLTVRKAGYRLCAE